MPSPTGQQACLVYFGCMKVLHSMPNPSHFSRKRHPSLVEDRDLRRPQAGLIQVKLTFGATNASRGPHESSFHRNIFGTDVNSLRIIRSNTAPTPLNNA